MSAGPKSYQRLKEASIGTLILGGEPVNAVDNAINLINGITASAAEINTLTGVVGGTTAASSALVVDATKNLDTLSITTLKLGATGGTSVTSTAAEINVLHSVTAGTTRASSALVVDANKNLDTLVITTLKLGSGTGTAVTATAAEINVLHSVVAGTASASSAAVLGANKNLDTLVIAASGLKIGSGAGTAVTSVANDLNLVSGMVAATQGIKKIAKVALSGTAIHAAVTNWQNPEAVSIIVNRITIDVTTIATGAATLSSGTTAVSATTASQNLVDTLDVHGGTGVFDNIQNPGSLGKPLQKLASAKWVTFKEQSGDVTGLVGNAYIEYELI